MANDPKLVKAANNAAAILEATYKWLDRVDAAGGATSISGIAACHAMLKSMRANRKRVDELVMRPMNELLLEEINNGKVGP